MKILWIFLGGSSQNSGLSFLCILGSFLKVNVQNGDIYPHAFLKKRRGYCNRLRPSVRPSVRLSVRPSVTLSPPKPLDEIQPNLVCELLT